MRRDGEADSLAACYHPGQWQRTEAMHTCALRVRKGSMMDFAVTMFPADYAMDIPELARESEARGFESLWFPEHTHMPVATELNSTGTGPLADEYRHTLDQWVALAAAAVVTSKIKLGSGICLVTQRDPILLAKEVASVDHLSKG